MLEWAKIGYVLNDMAIGNLKQTNKYCSFKTRYYTFDEVHLDEVKAKEIIKNKYQEYRLNAKKKKEKIKEQEKKREEYKTKYQWLNVNRIINFNAKKIIGEELNKRYPYCASYGSSYYYYHISNTHEASSEEELRNAIEDCKSEYERRYKDD